MNYFYQEAKEILTDLENYRLEIHTKREELDQKIKDYTEVYQELKLETQASEMILNLKKLQKYNIKKTELENIDKHITDLEVILEKETEMIDKMKLENQEIVFTEKDVYEELEEQIRLYKEFSGMDVEKTEDGFLKIIFSNLNFEKIDAYVKLEISNNAYKIVDIFPKIDYKHLQEMLKLNSNFTYFLASLVENFIQHFDKKI